MSAQLEWTDSPDAGLDACRPGDPAGVGFLPQAGTGPEDGEGADIVDPQAGTPEWLRRRIDIDGMPAFAFGTSVRIVKASIPR